MGWRRGRDLRFKYEDFVPEAGRLVFLPELLGGTRCGEPLCRGKIDQTDRCQECLQEQKEWIENWKRLVDQLLSIQNSL